MLPQSAFFCTIVRNAVEMSKNLDVADGGKHGGSWL